MMKFSILLSVLMIFTAAPIHCMKQLKKNSQLMLQRSIKNTEKLAALNYEKHNDNFTLNNAHSFENRSANVVQNSVERNDNSKQLISVIKDDNAYKGSEKNAKFQLYNTTKRYFHSTRQVQGPLFGFAMYKATKALLYGATLVSIGAAASIAGPAAGGAAAIVTSGAGTGAVVAGATLATDAAVAAVVTQGTVATISAAGSWAAYVAFVEGCAIVVGAACGMAPSA